MNRIIFFGISLFLISLEAKSQFYVKTLQWRPTGELGFLFNKSMGLELGGKNDFDKSHFRSRGSVAFLKQKPRMSAFPINAFYYSNGQLSFYPAVEIIKKYNITQFSIGLDFTPTPKKKLKPLIGLDITVSAISTNIESNGGPVEREENGSTAALSIKGRLGIEYDINNRSSLFFEAQRQYGLIVETMWYSANDIGFGINYSFN